VGDSSTVLDQVRPALSSIDQGEDTVEILVERNTPFVKLWADKHSGQIDYGLITLPRVQPTK
jgi:hypothetical protein